MPPTLTERRRVQTRAEIVNAAIDLFTRRGFDEVTMEDIAVAVNVSRRTAYRHFATKDDIVFEHPRQWFEHFRDVVDHRADHESTRDVIVRALMAVAEQIQSTRDDVLAAYSVLVATPNLRGRHSRSDAEWIAFTVAVISPDLERRADGVLIAATIAGAFTGVTNALIAVWAAGQPHAHLPTLTATALDHFDMMWPEECRTT